MKQLTSREKQIARLISEGHSDKFIAKELSKAVITVKRNTGKIFIKFDVYNRIELAMLIKAPLDSPFRKLIEEKNRRRNE
jgi:DNA-binding NarL/FixJ family response regulator